MSRYASFLDEARCKELCEHIYEETGINFAEGKTDVLSENARRRAEVIGVNDAAEYVAYAQSAADELGEVLHLIGAVSTNETSFFRHANQMKAFAKLVAQIIAKKKACGERSLKIWSTACATGEEPYSLAMMVDELLEGEDDWEIVLSATDINPHSIKTAQHAHFSSRSLRHIEEAYVAKYVRCDEAFDDGHYLSEELISRVQFDAVSLVDRAAMAAFSDYDIIFCRNVLNYFDEAAKRAVLTAIYDSLRPGGYLVLGPSDSLHGLSDVFQRCGYSVHNFFMKPETASVDAEDLEDTEASRVSGDKRLDLDADQGPQLRELVQFIDRGTRDIRVDIDSSLSSAIEVLSSVADVIGNLQNDPELSDAAREKLSEADTQFMQALLFLQVGDRITQKSEALRAALQELSDYLLGADVEAPDLNVNVSSFDENILPAKSGDDRDKNAMSQDDIDALFGS